MKYEPFGCPIRYALGVFGDKWSLLIIRDIMLKGRTSYGAFQNAGEGISTSVLADRLNHLEAQGIVGKHKDEAHGKKFIYSLTQKGKDMVDIVFAIISWAEKYDEKTLVEPDFIQAMQQEPEQLKQRVLNQAYQ